MVFGVYFITSLTAARTRVHEVTHDVGYIPISSVSWEYELGHVVPL